MLDIALHHIGKRYYTDTILSDIHFEIHTGDRIGLIGANGSGKTTLLKIISGLEAPTFGKVYQRSGVRIGYLEQIPEGPSDQKVEEVLRASFSELEAMKRELRSLEQKMMCPDVAQRVLERYSTVQMHYEVMGGYTMDTRLNQVGEGLGLKGFMKRRFLELSGGEQTRVAIAVLLLQAPDVLLLDEPTNHLDVEMLNWLEKFITQYPGAVLMISHDRYFLDSVAETIVEIEQGCSQMYHGAYSFYAVEKAARRERLINAYKAQQREMKRIHAAIARFRLWGEISDDPRFFTKAKQFEKRLEAMEPIILPRPSPSEQRFEVNASKKSSKRMITVTHMTKRYGGDPLFEAIDFEILRGERVCIVGANGSGKTTLLRAILGEIPLDEGSAHIAQSAEDAVGYLRQIQVFDTPGECIVDYVKRVGSLSEGEARTLLGRYGIRGEEVFRSLESLSGGEKSRISLMLFTLESYTLMLLDEPTNHLDIDSREALEEMLTAFEGTLLCVSHDRYFIESVATRILWLYNGKLYDIIGGYEAYERRRAHVLKAQIHLCPASGSEMQSKIEVKTPKRLNHYRITKCEQEIQRLEAAIKEKQGEMAQACDDYEALLLLEDACKALEREHAIQIENWVQMQT